GQRAALVDARLDVVPRHALAGANAVEIDLRLDALVGGDRRIGNVDPEVALRAHDRDPKLALEEDLGARRPDSDHGAAGITVGQHIRDVGSLSHPRSIDPRSLAFKRAPRREGLSMVR